MVIKPVHIDVEEIYNLGKIIRSYNRYDGRKISGEEIDFCVCYRKKTLHGNSKFVLNENLQFESPDRPFIPEYFYDHLVYGGTISKYTNKKGKVSRELKLRNSLGLRGLETPRPLDLSEWEDDIVQKLKELPPHVRDVVGL